MAGNCLKDWRAGIGSFHAEYPRLRERIGMLEGEKTSQTPNSLSDIWAASEAEALEVAKQLVEIGFFELRGSKESPKFWVPFLYCDALNMVQGTMIQAMRAKPDS